MPEAPPERRIGACRQRERLHWQIPDAEILYRGTIPFLRFRDPPMLLFGSL